MNTDFINLTAENLANEHVCCIIRFGGKDNSVTKALSDMSLGELWRLFPIQIQISLSIGNGILGSLGEFKE